MSSIDSFALWRARHLLIVATSEVADRAKGGKERVSVPAELVDFEVRAVGLVYLAGGNKSDVTEAIREGVQASRSRASKL